MEELYIEIRGIYDGWSVYVDKQGFMHNRWDPEKEHSRFQAVQSWLDEHYPLRMFE